jgi:hypothetical protein
MSPWHHRELKLYRRLGVRFIRPFVAGGTFWQNLGWASKQASWRPQNVHLYLRQIIAAEIAHLTSALVLLFIAMSFALDGDYLSASILSSINIVINVMPLMVIRYNKLRIQHRLNQRQLRSQRSR